MYLMIFEVFAMDLKTQVLDSVQASRITLSDLCKVEVLVKGVIDHPGDSIDCQEHLHTLIEEILQLCSAFNESGQSQVRHLMAQLGDAYEFFRLTGDISLLTAFLGEAKSLKNAIG
jgi:hypothetical protein